VDVQDTIGASLLPSHSNDSREGQVVTINDCEIVGPPVYHIAEMKPVRPEQR